MSFISLNPYILLNGTASEAIELYERVLGAKTDNISRYGDTPGSNVPAERANWVMHAQLHVGEAVIMISDAPPENSVPNDGNVQIALHYSGVEEMAKAFDGLAAGGKVVMPLQDTFWGAKFGMLADAHGVRWMFNCELKKAD